VRAGPGDVGRGERRARGGQGDRRHVARGAGGAVLLGPAGNLDVTRRLIVESRVAMVANPGPASYAAVVLDAESGQEVAVASAAIGESSSIAAEYRGLIAGLAAAARLGPGEPAEVRLTSEVVIFQMTGRHEARNSGLRSLRDQAMRVTAAFSTVVFTKTSTADTARVYQLALEALGTHLHDAQASGDQDRQAITVGGAAAAGAASARYRAAKAGTGTADLQRLGAVRSAELLGELTGLSVDASDVEELAAAGVVSVVGHYKKRPLYDVAALRALAADDQHRKTLAEMIRNSH
jgi:ribonuclease HI